MKRKLTCTNYFILLQKRFPREHTKNPNDNVRALLYLGQNTPNYRSQVIVVYVHEHGLP